MYKVVIEKRAQKFISKLSKDDQVRILKAISMLPKGDVKCMKGHNNLYRLRVGTYRVIYEINESVLVITIIDAGNRGQIYKKY